MAEEMIPLSDLLSQWGNAPCEAFTARARYYEGMDVVLYLQEDVSYRADRVDPFLTLLWHPYEDRAVGIKLKGWHYLFRRLQSILQAAGVNLPDEQFVPLISAVEVALTAGVGETLTADEEQRRVEKQYAKARELVAGVQFDARESALAA